MSENENQPPTPSKQTSSVPLKKETVRVTLKAADSPPAVPSATVSMAPPVRPPVPGAPPTPTGGPPRPPAPAPTIPLRPAGAPTVGPAPTIRLASSPTGAVRPAGAPTGVVRPAGPPTGLVKPPGAGAGAPPPTIALPKATVQLQPPTQPLGTSFSSTPQLAAVQSDDEEEEEDAEEGIIKILSGVGLAAALIVLGFQLKAADAWINVQDTQSTSGWMQLFE